MAYVDREWSNGDVPTAVKGNGMQDNLDYVREVLRGRIAAQEATAVEMPVASTTDWDIRVNIGALEWTSSSVTSTGYVELAGLKNKDISTLTDGVAYLLTISGVSVGGAVTRYLASTYVAHADGNFLSVFGEARKASASHLAELRGYTAIVTRDDEGF